MVSYNNSSSEGMSQQNSHYHHGLSSVHKSSSSKICKKAQQPKVYKVKPIHFRELVQKLTGAPAELHPQTKPQLQSQTQIQSRRMSNLQRVAPPPLPLHHKHQQFGAQNQTGRMGIEEGRVEPVDQKPLFGGFEGTTELTLSPNFQAWFSFAMLSPGSAAVSQMEQRAVS